MATPTHREPERMSNATKTQIVAWMINKWRAKIIGRELYNRRDSPWRGDKKFKGKNTVATQTILATISNQYILEHISSD